MRKGSKLKLFVKGNLSSWNIINKGQATKSAQRMTWYQEPMKDVISCENLRVDANSQRSVGVRMGKPT